MLKIIRICFLNRFYRFYRKSVLVYSPENNAEGSGCQAKSKMSRNANVAEMAKYGCGAPNTYMYGMYKQMKYEGGEMDHKYKIYE